MQLAQNGLTVQTCQCLCTPPVHVDKIFVLLLGKNDMDSWQRSAPNSI